MYATVPLHVAQLASPREGRGWTRTGFPREGFGVGRYCAAAHSGLVGPLGADRLSSSLTKGAQYSLRLSIGRKFEFYVYKHVRRTGIQFDLEISQF